MLVVKQGKLAAVALALSAASGVGGGLFEQRERAGVLERFYCPALSTAPAPPLLAPENESARKPHG